MDYITLIKELCENLTIQLDRKYTPVTYKFTPIENANRTEVVLKAEIKVGNKVIFTKQKQVELLGMCFILSFKRNIKNEENNLCKQLLRDIFNQSIMSFNK